MFYVYFVILAYLFKISDSLNYLAGWNYINLHCRDNDNAPVDWWYIYKPPSLNIPYITKGDNYTYISPATEGKWQYSNTYLSGNSMLYNTLSPLHRQSYIQYLAVIAYEHKSHKSLRQGNSAYGIIMADEMGGAWIGHSVPGLLDLTKDRFTFPHAEKSKGHLIVCLSLDLVTLNKLGVALKQNNAKFTTTHIPTNMRNHLPMWNFLSLDLPSLRSGAPSIIEFSTKENTLSPVLMISQPGETDCLYETFARKNNIVLDVYGHRHFKGPKCEKEYSLRNIDTISIKAPYHVSYIVNKTDQAGFAVSTAAHWQRTGAGPKQFWACVNGGPNEASILCVNDYTVWISFDNLKVKEPEC